MEMCIVKSKNVDDLKVALSRMFEYARFLEKETGRSNDSFAKVIMDDEDITYVVKEQN